MNIFLDTEFTNLTGEEPDLISLALVTERYEELYVETTFTYAKCTDFVRNVVIPRLDLEPHAFVARGHLRVHILSWLDIVRRGQEDILICADYDGDFTLFEQAMDGRMPEWVRLDNINGAVSPLLHERYFEDNQLPDGRLAQHHALYDARALMHAFRPALRDEK